MAYLLHQLLTESAARLPEKEALSLNGTGMTYAQLECLTNQLAWQLRRSGVQRGDRVGIYLHKSPASIISVFGVMKAGGTYVPLDPNGPPKRLAYITRNCDIRVLLTSPDKITGVAQLIGEDTPVEVLVLMDDHTVGVKDFPVFEGIRVVPWGAVQREPDSPVKPNGTIETDLAYILYTSGSTGDPKGVMISHRTILTFINWCCETFHMNQDDRVTSHAPLQFDLSTFDIYGTIKAGGTIVLVPESLSVFPERLTDLLENEKITVTYLVPSILSMMANYGNLTAHDFTSLRLILFAGEVFPIKYLRRLATAIPHVDYYNLFGPTETNVCTYYKVQPKDVSPEQTGPVPIGVACGNTDVFAVNDRGEIVGEPEQDGELWVRGSCVAQGYWGDPQKTAERFVQNPFQLMYREVVYRTGDIVKLAEDRVNWRFVGRRDHMIKSRGYRIELGEIETTLYSHPAVKEVAVVAVPDSLVGNRIKAFVVLAEGSQIKSMDLENHCSQRVPRHMLPEHIEFRETLPKTSTGKIDKTLLASM